MGAEPMTLDLSHLTTATRELACNDAKARILSDQTARWVAFPRAGVAVEELERRFHYPTCARMPCMLLYGDSGMGKTMILEKMERQHPNSYDERHGITKKPVLVIQMPASPDERRFYTRILEVLGAPYSTRDQIGALEGRVIHLLKQLGTQLLFIDEVHHLLAGSHREQRRALNLLKFLTNELKIVIVAVGTSDAYHALQTDVQVASRFEPLLIPRWTEPKRFAPLSSPTASCYPYERPRRSADPRCSAL
jgi:Cdc6-like AAA superfamily ATPase